MGYLALGLGKAVDLSNAGAEEDVEQWFGAGGDPAPAAL